MNYLYYLTDALLLVFVVSCLARVIIRVLQGKTKNLPGESKIGLTELAMSATEISMYYYKQSDAFAELNNEPRSSSTWEKLIVIDTATAEDAG